MKKALAGRQCSEETREKLRKANTGQKRTEEAKNKMRIKATGRKHTKETIIKISGENNSTSKLKRWQVDEIRKDYGNRKLVNFAKEYNVSARTIARTLYNVDWYDENYIPPIPRKINHKGTPKLNLEKANTIRELYFGGKADMEKLSKDYGVTQCNIKQIIDNKIWRNK
jgi:hypothetical protein